jgi:hypothetical protein
MRNCVCMVHAMALMTSAVLTSGNISLAYRRVGHGGCLHSCERLVMALNSNNVRYLQGGNLICLLYTHLAHGRRIVQVSHGRQKSDSSRIGPQRPPHPTLRLKLLEAKVGEAAPPPEAWLPRDLAPVRRTTSTLLIHRTASLDLGDLRPTLTSMS